MVRSTCGCTRSWNAVAASASWARSARRSCASSRVDAGALASRRARVAEGGSVGAAASLGRTKRKCDSSRVGACTKRWYRERWGIRQPSFVELEICEVRVRGDRRGPGGVASAEERGEEKLVDFQRRNRAVREV